MAIVTVALLAVGAGLTQQAAVPIYLEPVLSGIDFTQFPCPVMRERNPLLCGWTSWSPVFFINAVEGAFYEAGELTIMGEIEVALEGYIVDFYLKSPGHVYMVLEGNVVYFYNYGR